MLTPPDAQPIDETLPPWISQTVRDATIRDANLVETRDGTRTARTLSRCLRVTEGLDHAGRVDFVHGISHYFLGQRDAALAAELRVVETLDLRSPRGYFLDAVAMLAVFLRGASPEHDRYVLRRLERFRTRMQGVRDWTVVRVCLRWVEGQLLARLGDFDSASQRLDGVRSFLLENGPLRQAVAVTDRKRPRRARRTAVVVRGAGARVRRGASWRGCGSC